MRILCVFPSGSVLDRTALGEEAVAEIAAEFPTLIYLFY